MYVQLFLFSFLITILVLLILTLLNVQRTTAQESFKTCSEPCPNGCNTTTGECNET